MDHEAFRMRLMEKTRIKDVSVSLVSFDASAQEIVVEIDAIASSPWLQENLEILEPPRWRDGRWGIRLKLNLQQLFQLSEKNVPPTISVVHLREIVK